MSILLCLLSGFLIPLVLAQSKSCKHEKVYRDLQANIENGSNIFCRQLLEKVVCIGTLRKDPTLCYYATVTDTKSKDHVFVYRSSITKVKTTITSYESQNRQAGVFTAPLPIYVQLHPTAKVMKAW